MLLYSEEASTTVPSPYDAAFTLLTPMHWWKGIDKIEWKVSVDNILCSLQNTYTYMLVRELAIAMNWNTFHYLLNHFCTVIVVRADRYCVELGNIPCLQ